MKSPTEIYDVVTDERAGFELKHRVRFQVQPPKVLKDHHRDELIRLHTDEGWIEVSHDGHGGLQIMSSQTLMINPRSSNSITIRLADDRLEDDT